MFKLLVFACIILYGVTAEENSKEDLHSGYSFTQSDPWTDSAYATTISMIFMDDIMPKFQKAMNLPSDLHSADLINSITKTLIPKLGSLKNFVNSHVSSAVSNPAHLISAVKIAIPVALTLHTLYETNKTFYEFQSTLGISSDLVSIYERRTRSIEKELADVTFEIQELNPYLNIWIEVYLHRINEKLQVVLNDILDLKEEIRHSLKKVEAERDQIYTGYNTITATITGAFATVYYYSNPLLGYFYGALAAVNTVILAMKGYQRMMLSFKINSMGKQLQRLQDAQNQVKILFTQLRDMEIEMVYYKRTFGVVPGKLIFGTLVVFGALYFFGFLRFDHLIHSNPVPGARPKSNVVKILFRKILGLIRRDRNQRRD